MTADVLAILFILLCCFAIGILIAQLRVMEHYCKKCQISTSSRYCYKCGHLTEEKPKSPCCRRYYDPSYEKFCRRCGKNLNPPIDTKI